MNENWREGGGPGTRRRTRMFHQQVGEGKESIHALPWRESARPFGQGGSTTKGGGETNGEKDKEGIYSGH